MDEMLRKSRNSFAGVERRLRIIWSRCWNSVNWFAPPKGLAAEPIPGVPAELGFKHFYKSHIIQPLIRASDIFGRNGAAAAPNGVVDPIPGIP